MLTEKNNGKLTRKDLLSILEAIGRRREQEADPGFACAAEAHIRERLGCLARPDAEDGSDPDLVIPT